MKKPIRILLAGSEESVRRASLFLSASAKANDLDLTISKPSEEENKIDSFRIAYEDFSSMRLPEPKKEKKQNWFDKEREPWRRGRPLK